MGQESDRDKGGTVTAHGTRSTKDDVLGYVHARQAASVVSGPVSRSPPGFSVGCSRQEYGHVLLCPPPGGLPNLGLEPVSLTSPVLAGGFYSTGAT